MKATLVRTFEHSGETFRVVQVTDEGKPTVRRGQLLEDAKPRAYGLIEKREKDALGAERWTTIATLDSDNATATLLLAALIDTERGRVLAAVGFPTRVEVENAARSVWPDHKADDGELFSREDFVLAVCRVVDRLKGAA